MLGRQRAQDPKPARFLIMISLVLVLGPIQPQFAMLFYADPGSGILIWQLATAGALGLLFYARTIIRRIRLFTRARESKENETRTFDS